MASIYINAIEASTSCNSVLRGRLKNEGWRLKNTEPKTRVCEVFRSFLEAWDVDMQVEWWLWRCGIYWKAAGFAFFPPNWWIRQAGARAAERKVAFLAASKVVQVCVCFCVHNFACLPFYDCEHKKLHRLQKLACRGRVWWWHNKGFPQSILPV